MPFTTWFCLLFVTLSCCFLSSYGRCLNPRSPPSITWQNSSQSLPSLSQSRFLISSALYNNTVFSIGGYYSPTQSIISLNKLKNGPNTWSEDTTWSDSSYAVGGLSVIASYNSHVRVNDRLYIVAPGDGDANGKGTLLIYDLLNKEIVSGSSYTYDMSIAITTDPCVVTNESHIFAMGGRRTDFDYFQFMQIYDIDNDIWTIGPNMTEKRWGSFCYYSSLNNRIYMFGGRNNSHYISEIEYFDFDLNTWSILDGETISVPRRSGGQLEIENYFYLIAGEEAGQFYDTIDIFDATTETILKNVSSDFVKYARKDSSISIIYDESEDTIWTIGGYKANTHIYQGTINCVPTSAPTEPSMNPTNIPSMIPSGIPSLQPSSVPTNSPNSYKPYDYSLYVVLHNSLYDGNDIESSNSLKSDINDAMVDGSIAVVTQLSNEDDIDCKVISASDIDCSSLSDTSFCDYGYNYTVLLSLNVTFLVESDIDHWESSLSSVLSLFDVNLQSQWGVSVDVEIYELSSSQTTLAGSGNNNTDNDPFSGNGDSSNEEYEQELADLETFAIGTPIVVAVIVLVAATAGAIDAWLSKNEVFRVTKFITIYAYTVDVISDLFFVLQLWIVYKYFKEGLILVLFLLALLFTISPIVFNLKQLFGFVRKWDREALMYDQEYLGPWLQTNNKILYLSSVLLGSGFAGITLFNSNWFRFPVFHMGLIQAQLIEFQLTRLFSVVLAENVPQLIIQLLFSFYEGFGVIAILSFGFSILSIVLSLLEYLTTKSLLTGNIILVKFEYESSVLMDMTHNEFLKFVARPRTLADAIGTSLSITDQNVEVVKPYRTPHGAIFVALIRTNISDKANEMIRLLNEEPNTLKIIGQRMEKLYPKLKAKKSQTAESIPTKITVCGEARRLVFEKRRLSVHPSMIQLQSQAMDTTNAQSDDLQEGNHQDGKTQTA